MRVLQNSRPPTGINFVPFTIRDYRPDDFERLWEIDQVCFPPGISYSRSELGIYVSRRNAFTLIAQADDPDVDAAGHGDSFPWGDGRGPAVGIEPTTTSLKGSCATVALRAP